MRKNMGETTRFFIFKGLRMASLLVAISFISFILMKNSPIDPVQAYIGADMLNVGPEQRERIAEYWGLNEPVLIQYANWASAVLQGDLGTSMIHRRPVSEIIGERFMSSLALMLVAWTLSGVMGFVLGVVAAMKKGTWIDRAIQWYCYTFLSLNPYFLDGTVSADYLCGMAWLVSDRFRGAGRCFSGRCCLFRSSKTPCTSGINTQYPWGCKRGTAYPSKAH